MKNKFLILILALILAASISVPAFADNTVVRDGDVTTITDENGNTIIIEEVDESGDSGSVNITKPTPSPAPTPKTGGSGSSQTGSAPSGGSGSNGGVSGEGAHDETETTLPDAQADPAEADEDGAGAADGQETSADTDNAKDEPQEKSKDDSAPKGADTTRIVILAVIAALCVAGAVYLAVDLKKKNKG